MFLWFMVLYVSVLKYHRHDKLLPFYPKPEKYGLFELFLFLHFGKLSHPTRYYEHLCMKTSTRQSTSLYQALYFIAKLGLL